MATPPLYVIALAAGKGTRMKAGKVKVLLEAAGRPLLGHVLESARALRPSEIVAVIPKDPPAELTALLAQYKAAAAVQDPPRGTADAVKVALSKISAKTGNAMILIGDAPLMDPATLRKLLNRHKQAKALLSVLSFVPPDPGAYGRIIRDPFGAPERITEHKDLGKNERERHRECNTGFWVVDLPWLRKQITKINNKNASGEFYLTDLFEIAANEGRARAVVADDPECCIGVNTQAELAIAAALLRERKMEALLAKGVTIVDPYHTYIDVTAEVGAGTVIEPGVLLQGETKIAADCRIRAGAVIRDSLIGKGASVLPYSVIEESSVGPLAQIGPMAHLRPGSKIGKGAKVGNYVELKKAELGEGAKANHLSYLGDAKIGAGANIGAGTITCNYDGTNKHVTEIGAEAFIGSDTQLVAPVKVGKGAYVGSGTTVTKNVPAGALAVSRAPQKNIPGWAARNKKKKK